MNNVIHFQQAIETEEKPFSLNDYQKWAHSTSVYPSEHQLVYSALGLTNEAGEYAGKIKKKLRGDVGFDPEAAGDELGDVLWYLAECATNLGITLEDIAKRNVEKIERRKAAGTIKGNGDKR